MADRTPAAAPILAVFPLVSFVPVSRAHVTQNLAKTYARTFSKRERFSTLDGDSISRGIREMVPRNPAGSIGTIRPPSFLFGRLA